MFLKNVFKLINLFIFDFWFWFSNWIIIWIMRLNIAMIRLLNRICTLSTVHLSCRFWIASNFGISIYYLKKWTFHAVGKSMFRRSSLWINTCWYVWSTFVNAFGFLYRRVILLYIWIARDKRILLPKCFLSLDVNFIWRFRRISKISALALEWLCIRVPQYWLIPMQVWSPVLHKRRRPFNLIIDTSVIIV